jgi:hypothetical protein
VSFDLVVFDAVKAPKDRKSFLAWWKEISAWNDEGHDYNNPDLTTPSLRAWFMDMISEFPPMNGPYAKDELPEEESVATDYTIGKAVIHAAFAWSKGEQAGDAVIRCAERHKVGVFNVSSPDGQVYIPGPNGELQLAHAD